MTERAADRMGEVRYEGGMVGLRYVRHLPHPPGKVWRALTESESLRHWFPADIVGERAAGAKLRLPFWPEAIAQAGEELADRGVDPDELTSVGELLAWEPPRVFEFTWRIDQREELADRLRFELAPSGDGTRLVFLTWLGGRPPAEATEIRRTAGTATGWHVCLDELARLLDQGRTSPADQAAAIVVQRVKARVAELSEQYAALLSTSPSGATGGGNAPGPGTTVS